MKLPKRVLLFTVFVLLSGTWAQGGLAFVAQWEKKGVGEPAPSVRRGVEGVYDDAGDRLVFQGGETPPPARFYPDTWFFNLEKENWERFDGGQSDPRCHHTFLVDTSQKRGLLFGGFPRTNKLWSWDLVNSVWTDITPGADNPAPRCLHSAVVCKPRNWMIIYGGLNGGFVPDLDDVWAYDLEADEWSLLVEDSAPGRRYGHVAVIDETRDRMIVFGGFAIPPGNPSGGMVDVGDLWEFDLDTQVWNELLPSTPGPSARQFAKGANLPDGSGLILFGGRSNGTYLNDLWFLDYDTLEWAELSPEGTPPDPRFRHSLVAAEEENRLWIAFGEGLGGEHFSDIWMLNIIQESSSHPTLTNERSDIDGDGFVNSKDLLMLMQDWRK